MRLAYLLLVLALLSSGCANQVTEPSYYLLRPSPDLPSGELNPSSNFALGNVVMASYLDQPGLLMETDDGRLRPARQNLWAEPVYEGVRNILFVEIAQAKGEELLPSKISAAKTVVDIRIDELHGTNDGHAKLIAYWWLHRDGEILGIHRFSRSRALTTDGYSALVAAEEGLLTEFAQAIAASLTVPEKN
jgi:uncharacterized protein